MPWRGCPPANLREVLRGACWAPTSKLIGSTVTRATAHVGMHRRTRSRLKPCHLAHAPRGLQFHAAGASAADDSVAGASAIRTPCGVDFGHTTRSRLRARACALWRALTGTYGALRRHGYEGRVYAREHTRRALYSLASFSGCMRESIRCMRDRTPNVCAGAYRYQRPGSGQAART